MEVKIERLGINGEGIAKISNDGIKNKICFVEGALPGEIVDIDITQENNKFCKGNINKFNSEYSKSRVEPKCPFFGCCGGCDLQHMSMESQRKFKQDRVNYEFLKYVKGKFNVEKTIFVNDFNYRNKMVFPFVLKNGQVYLGMFKSNSHEVISINNCLLAEDKINRVLVKSNEYFRNFNNVYDFKSKKGLLKYLVVRVVSDQILITIVVTKKYDFKEYFERLKSDFNLLGVSILISNSDVEILNGKYEHQYGIDSIKINEYGIEYNVNNLGFLQVNNEIKKLIYDKILDMININDNIIDAYSGAGLLTTILANKCNKVYGIEINKSAHQSSVELVKKNMINNVEFYNYDCKEILPKLLDNLDNCIILLDPPRSGCEKQVIELINQSNNINKIIYISCNPATLVRDVNLLLDNYNITSITPYDMFPNTKHIETLVCLQRRV